MRLTLEEAVEKRRIFCQETQRWWQPCLYCATMFPVRTTRRYCSEDCSKKVAKEKYQRKPTEKDCLNCGSKFIANRSDKVYCSTRCGNNLRGAKWEANNPDKVKLHREATRERSWRNYALSRVKSKSKKFNIPFDLGPSDLEMPETCPVLGIILNYNNKGNTGHLDSPSIDRIIPDLGYTKNNVRVISVRANLLKSNATVAELELVLTDLKKIEASIK